MGYIFLKLILLAFWLFIGYTVVRAFSSFAPWVPIFNRDIKRVVELADLKKNENFLDLGCGDGRMCQAMARLSEGNVVGVELAWPLYAVCKIRELIYNKANLKFKFGDLFKANLDNINVIYIYGLPSSIKKNLSDKIMTQARPGTRVISYCFEFPKLELSVMSQPTEKNLPIYKYIIKPTI